jgi:hypothetical protein
MQRGEGQGVGRHTRTHLQAPMLLKTPSLSPLSSLSSITKSVLSRVPVALGQAPMRSKMPFSSLEKSQPP